MYKFGSSAARHDAEDFAANRIQWMGLSVCELESLQLDRSALVPTSVRDIKKVCLVLISSLTFP